MSMPHRRIVPDNENIYESEEEDPALGAAVKARKERK
jgi:hypothetical protein